MKYLGLQLNVHLSFNDHAETTKKTWHSQEIEAISWQ